MSLDDDNDDFMEEDVVETESIQKKEKKTAKKVRDIKIKIINILRSINCAAI